MAGHKAGKVMCSLAFFRFVHSSSLLIVVWDIYAIYRQIEITLHAYHSGCLDLPSAGRVDCVLVTIWSLHSHDVRITFRAKPRCSQ